MERSTKLRSRGNAIVTAWHAAARFLSRTKIVWDYVMRICSEKCGDYPHERGEG